MANSRIKSGPRIAKGKTPKFVTFLPEVGPSRPQWGFERAISSAPTRRSASGGLRLVFEGRRWGWRKFRD